MPRGSHLLRKTTSRELHIDPLDGTGPRVIAKNVDSWTPSADGRRVLFVSSNIIQSVPATAGPPVTVWKGPDGLQIMDLVDLPDRRMIVALARVRADSGIALHLLQTDSTGVVVHAPRRLTEWRQELPRSLSSSADGSRVVFLSETAQSDVYVADFDMKSGALSTPKRLTLDDRDDLPTDWSPDSNAVLFVSTRNGTADIFKQNIHSDTAEPLVTGPGDQTNARVASGGRWLLYFDGLATPPSA